VHSSGHRNGKEGDRGKEFGAPGNLNDLFVKKAGPRDKQQRNEVVKLKRTFPTLREAYARQTSSSIGRKVLLVQKKKRKTK